MAVGWLSILGPGLKPALFPYWLISRGMTLGVRCAAISENGSICLVKHTYAPGWHFPGGGVEAGETSYQALAKELSEEAGISLMEEPSLFGIYANSTASRRDHVLMFIAKNWRQTEISLPTREIAEVAEFNPEDLPDDVTPGTRRRLSEILQGTPRDTVW